jgi:hypothetical protein
MTWEEFMYHVDEDYPTFIDEFDQCSGFHPQRTGVMRNFRSNTNGRSPTSPLLNDVAIQPAKST